MSSVKWLPLESNPEVMNQFLKHMGVPSKWSIADVFSLDDDELLALVPQPVLAVLLLFPTSAENEDLIKEQGDDIMASGSHTEVKVYFLKQTIKNACGTVALIHSIANNLESIKLDENSPLQKFLSLTRQMSPEERAKELEKNVDIGLFHETCAQQGQTETPNIDDDTNLHFVAFVNVGGQLYELDGRKPVPVIHGPTSENSFMKDAGKMCKEFMKRDPNDMRFTVLALGPTA